LEVFANSSGSQGKSVYPAYARQVQKFSRQNLPICSKRKFNAITEPSIGYFDTQKNKTKDTSTNGSSTLPSVKSCHLGEFQANQKNE